MVLALSELSDVAEEIIFIILVAGGTAAFLISLHYGCLIDGLDGVHYFAHLTYYTAPVRTGET